MRLANRNGKISRGVRRRLFLEGLASRYLLAGVTAEVLDDIATISGSSANDEVVIAPMTLRDEVHVFANGQCISAWRQSEVREITVESLGGDDLIRVADSVPGAVKITGGVGLDTVLIDRPHDHRHGWLFDVERVMAEGEFASASAVGNDAHSQHAGHGISNASSQMQLFPIPTDHLHVDLQPEPIHEVAPAVHEHGTAAETSITPVPDTSADPSVLPVHDTTSEISPITEPEHGSTHDAPDINLPTTALDRELILPGSDLSITPHTSHIDQEAELDTLDDTTGISSTLVVIRSGSDPEPGEHAGHDPFAVSTDAPASSEHAGHGTSAGSTDVQASSEHTGHGTSAGSTGGGEHSGHAGLNASAGSTLGGDHSGHSGNGASAGTTGGLGHSGHAFGESATGHEHGGDTTSTIHSGHVSDIEESIAIELGSATTRNASHHDHATGDSSAGHGARGHDHGGRWGVSPVGSVLTGLDARSGHQCEGTHGKPASGSGGDHTEHHQESVSNSVPACHPPAGNPKTDATIPQPDAGTQDVEQGEAKPDNRPATKSSHLAMLLAATGTLFLACAVRPRRSAIQTNDLGEQAPRLSFEWLGGRGASNI
jgi:hypothetical protein